MANTTAAADTDCDHIDVHPPDFPILVVSIKRELPVPFGFHLSATGGLGFPTGASKISSHGYDRYIQFRGRIESMTIGRCTVCSQSPGLRASIQSTRRSRSSALKVVIYLLEDRTPPRP